jgi:putative DNA primase/helicase
MIKTPFPVNVDTVKADLLSRLPSVLSYLYPEGRISGSELEIGNVDGDEGKSMKIALRGDKAGLWIDNATGEQGDILHLWAIKHRLCIKTQFSEIIKNAADWLGISPAYQQHPSISAKKASQTYENKSQKLTKQYPYYAIDGSLIAYINRYEYAKGKEFRCFDAVKKIYKAPIPRPLYNLPNIAQCEHIILCEGEKCADALISVGHCATTAMGGANTPLDKTDWLPLKGKHIWIWADHDKAGYAYAKRVSKHLKKICASVTQLNPPTDKPDKWDAADAVAEGINITEYIQAHTPIIPAVTKPFQAYKIGTLFNDTIPMPEDIIFPRLLTESGLLVFGGAPKVGKTDFLISFLVRMGLGQEFLGFKPKRALKIAYIQAEIGYHYLRERFNKISLTDEEKAFLADNLVVKDYIGYHLL